MTESGAGMQARIIDLLSGLVCTVSHTGWSDPVPPISITLRSAVVALIFLPAEATRAHCEFAIDAAGRLLVCALAYRDAATLRVRSILHHASQQ